MRLKREAVLAFEWNNDSLPKTVREWREKYKRMSRILDAHPGVLDAVDRDVAKLSPGGRRGRQGDFTSETILRALVVHAVEGTSLRETVVRIGESQFLQDFLRTRKRAVMDFTFLDKCFQAVRPETWRRINEQLGQWAAAEGMVETGTIRADTTAVETNIHWPTDASLLWDVWRVTARLLRAGRAIFPASCPNRFHDKKIKRLYLYITRYMASRSKARQRKVRRSFRTLIERVEWIVGLGEEFCRFARVDSDLGLMAVAAELEGFLPAMRKVVAAARRTHFGGETVPAAERVFSLFEPHTELIKRGRRDKPVEFGHMVLLCQTPEKFITDYEAYAERIADSRLTGSVVDRHETLFGRTPKVLAADKGFSPKAAEREALAERVGTLAIPRRTQDFADAVMRHWQAFRAGIEGTISGLKRALRLARCFYHGFKRFSSAIGMSVFCHNLLVLAKAGGT